ncbi:DUF7507 domain-containing protein [Actinoplanes awajinensis]|uniref:DUF11 domain-containing protein n=1 Tax=Actinoplanes awajinensis subsp. mycoplanecinus TaxID=135947 RepID=A0A101JIY7_9ACTN|nr:DUF11 domain-containing protein [Actinoplanes awajinensis]KUL27679.1 hypothetical protein ADL15_34580 [Actinoplanes awajinensis subsp. mycoplanecinus]
MTVGRYSALLAVLAVLLTLTVVNLPQEQQPARAAATTCGAPVLLTNGDFEAPALTVSNPASGAISITSQTNVPGWLTTATDKMIEIWHQPFQGVYAASGTQHAELNANKVSTLYQDLATTPGQVLRWQLSHRGRTGTDTMDLMIGAPGATVKQGSSFVDGKTAWGTYSGLYTVPAGQTTTQFAFKSVSSASADPSIGNFLDGIIFGTAACLTATTTASAATANVGDVLTYTVAATNNGGNPAQLTTLADDLPAGTVFVPGSIRSVTGSTTTAVSDTADGDTGEYDAATRTVRVRTGVGAGASTGGSIPVTESRSFSYQVRVAGAAAGTVLTDDATAAYTDPLAAAPRTAVSTGATTTVAPAADLGITAALAAGSVVAGRVATTNLTVTNPGPSSASGVQVSAVVPAGIVNVTATMSGATCTVTGQNARCDLPSLAAGGTGLMVVSGDVLPAATPGAQATLTGSVTSTTYELNQADNATSVSAAVATLADVGVTMTNTPGVAGAPITYTITVSNAGPSVARGLVLTDVIPSTATYTSAGGGTCARTAIGTLECQLADMAPGATTTVTLDMTLKPSGGGAVNNAVSVTGSTPDPSAANNNYSVQSSGSAVADVGVKLSLSQASAYAGDTVNYTLVVTNYGPSDATNVTFNTIVPPGVTIARNSPYCTPNACTVGTLPAGASVPLTGTATLDATAAAGPGFATTTVISPTYDDRSSNDTDTVNFTVLLRTDLAVTQTLVNPSDPATLVAGNDVRGRVTVVNNGQTRAEGVVLRQAVAAGQPVPAYTLTGGGGCAFQGTVTAGYTPDGGAYVCTLATMLKNTTWEVAFDPVPISAGYAAASYARTVEISATTGDPDPSNNTVTTTKPVVKRSDLQVTQTASTPSAVVSAEVGYRIRVTNLGPSDAAGVVLQESAPSGLQISASTETAGTTFDLGQLSWRVPVLLAPDIGDPAANVATVDLVAAAQVSGGLTVTASITTSGSTDPVSGNNSDSATITVAAAQPSLSVQNTATVAPGGRQNGVQAADSIAYRYDITNTGNLTMTALSVTTTRGAPVSCGGVTDLAPGATVVCTGATYTVTGGDVFAGLPLVDTVSVEAVTTLAADPVLYGRVASSIPIALAHASLAVVVVPAVTPVGHQNAAEAGDTVGYTYTVTNNGDRTMDLITLTDSLGATITCPQATLAVAASMTCTAATLYTVTQARVDAGTAISGGATVTATPAAGSPTSFGPFTTPVSVALAAPAITFTVTPAPATPVRAGDTVGYTYRVRNTGNVTLHALAVTDTLISSVTCPGGTLAVGAQVDCTSDAPYPVLQADVDAGLPVHDDAVAALLTPANVTVTASGSGPVPVVSPSAGLGVVSTATIAPAGHSGAVRAGDTITFQYVVTNTGNVTMLDIRVIDTLTGTAVCPGGPLAVHATVTCTSAAYPVTQADVDAGLALVATARAGGRAPAAATVTDYGSDAVTLPVISADLRLRITSDAGVTPGAHRYAATAGDVVMFQFDVVNDGTVTMRGITVTDELTGTAVCPSATLAVGVLMTCISGSAYTVTQADVDAGKPLGPASYVSATGPGSAVTVRFGPAYTYVPVAVGAPALTGMVTAAVDPPGRQGAAEPGDHIGWSYLITNNGNVTMTGVAVTDPAAGTVTCPRAVLAVRDVMTCTANIPYPVTQADVDDGGPITDEAWVSGSGARFGPFSASVALVTAAPALTLTMTPQVAPAGHAAGVTAGDTIIFRYAVSNTGNTTVERIALADTRTGAATCATTALARGEQMTCVSNRPSAVTQPEVDAGRALTASATLTGARPGATTTSTFATASAGVRVVTAAPKLVAKQTAAWTDRDGDGRLSLADDVVSTIVVTNTGNVTVTGLTVTGLPAGVTCAPTTLAPGESAICVSAAYHLTRTDLESGKKTYEAHADGSVLGSAGKGVQAVAPSTVVVPSVPRSPSPSPSRSQPGAGVDPIAAPITGPSTLPIMVMGWAMIVGGGAALLLTRPRRRPGAHRAHRAH